MSTIISINADSGYRGSYDSARSVGSAGTFGPASSPRRATVPPEYSQADPVWSGATQMAINSQMMEMLINLDSKVDQIGQSSTKLSTSFEALDKKADALTTKVTILEGRLDIHGTTLQTAKKTTESVKNTVENYKGDIAGIREEMQAMEKRLNDRLDELARSQNAGFDEINVSQKTFLDRIMHLFKQ